MSETKEEQEIKKEEEPVKDNKGKDKKARKADKEAEKQRYEAEINDLNTKLAEAGDKYIRLAAEFDNYRRRTAKERLEMISTAGEDVIKGFLPVMDDLERALDALKKSEASDAAKEGTELIYNKIFAFLKTKGVARMDVLGKPLDTDFHEAVAQFPVEDDEKKNKIIDVVQHGYTIHEKVLRFAKVVVGV